MEYIKYFFPISLAFILSASTLPSLILISKKLNLYDETDIRKTHVGNVSRIGGAAVFLSIIVITLVILPYHVFSFRVYLYFLAAIMAFLIGFTDDIRAYSAKVRLLLQFICAGLAVSSGLLSQDINLFGIVNIEFGFMSVIIILFTIVLFMNAINLIDGMDGIATVILFNAFIFLSIIGFISSNHVMITVSLIICGALLSFFIFNFPPAAIFLGDGGAYFLGFCLATLPMTTTKAAGLTAIPFVIPFILMILPLADLIYVAIGRFKAGVSILEPDKTHLHYRLSNLGLSDSKVLFLYLGFTLACGLMSLLLFLSETIFGLIFLILTCFITGIFFYMVKKSEKRLEG